MPDNAGLADRITKAITLDKTYSSLPRENRVSSEPAFATLFLDLHKIFISRAFVRIHTFFRNPLGLPWVELGRT
ncbi:MAG: hypothetical protein M0Q92_10265 [Methanoregula sp.]|jgi:hypothetical protein|nr:hypothetical protein [Methanoregula sp.]